MFRRDTRAAHAPGALGRMGFNQGQGHALISTDPATTTPTWSATTIDIISPPESISPLPYRRYLRAVSCPSTSLCVVVDDQGRAVVSTDPAAPAPTWSVPATIDNEGLLGISCPSTSLCVAVDEAGRDLISTDPTAAKPTWSAPATIDSKRLSGISCPSTSLCVAVDEAGWAAISTDPAGAGPTWSLAAAFPGAHNARPPEPGVFHDVSCASPSLCVIIDRVAAVISTNPTAATPTWSAPSNIDPPGAGTTSLLGSPVTNGSTLKFGLGCSLNALDDYYEYQECDGAAIIATTERLAANGHTVTGVGTAARAMRHRVVVIGRTTFVANTGTGTSTVAVALNSTGRRLLAKFKRLPATLRVSATAPELRVPPSTITVKTVNVTFKAKTTVRRKHRRGRRFALPPR